ncbi:MAG TPA: hypothetical protein VGE72_21500 [Azospirillum sp.]
MIIDKRLELSDAQAVTADARSTNVIDLGTVRQIGAGTPLWLVFSVDVAADATTGDETYTFQLHTDDNASFSSATTLESRTIAAATLVAGYQFSMAIPNTGMERYLSAYYDVGGTTPTITVSCWLTDQEPRSWRAYADGI